MQRNAAIAVSEGPSRDWLVVTMASQTCVVRPRCTALALTRSSSSTRAVLMKLVFSSIVAKPVFPAGSRRGIRTCRGVGEGNHGGGMKVTGGCQVLGLYGHSSLDGGRVIIVLDDRHVHLQQSGKARQRPSPKRWSSRFLVFGHWDSRDRMGRPVQQSQDSGDEDGGHGDQRGC